MIVELFDIDDRNRVSRALAIRTAVFVEEQGVPLDEEVDAHDRDDRGAVHALVLEAATAIGTGRYYESGPGVAHVGRMAVLAASRGAGAGRTLLRALVDDARRRGYERAHLHAQLHARPFYLKSGFRDDGTQLWDAGILHQPMSLDLIRKISGS